mgnify:CR=1 FL=1
MGSGLTSSYSWRTPTGQWYFHFVTKKIIKGACDISKGLQNDLVLGNINISRYWGYAEEYVEAMYLMLQQSKPDDYIIATGETRSLRDFIEIAAKSMGNEIVWSGEKENEIGTINGEVAIKVSKEFYRPYTTGLLVGDPSKIEKLGWTRQYDIHSLIEDMIKG